jgi:hypothetical protein
MTTESEAPVIAEMIQHAQREKARALERMDAAKKDVDRLNERLLHYQTTLRDIQTIFGVSDEPSIAMAPSLRSRYEGLSVSDIVRQWIVDHNGKIAVKELVAFTVESGLFRDADQGNGSVYSAIGRMVKQAELIRSRKGHYRTYKTWRGVRTPSQALLVTEGAMNDDAGGDE